MDPLRKHFPWLTDPDEEDWLRTECLRRAALGFEAAQLWREAAECWAEVGEHGQAGALYRRIGDLEKAAAAELAAGRYRAALELYQAWQQKLGEDDAFNQIKALLGQSACHRLAVEDRVAGQALYRQARALIADEGDRTELTSALCWQALGDYGALLGRYDLIQEGYEQALNHCRETPTPAHAVDICEAYLDAARNRGDRLLSQSLENRLTEWQDKVEAEAPGKEPPELLEMVELPGGTFWMGSPDTDDQAESGEKPQHEVTVSAFALARFPVTRGLYREIMGTAPEEWSEDQDDDQLPANYVTWFNAVAFCNRLSERQGLRPCYRIDGENVAWDRNAEGYRLATEAEWEYATRAGTTTRWFFGDDPAELDRYAWFEENAVDLVHPVDEKEPNPWGFHDLIGNVREWCWDWHGDYSAESVSNPTGPDGGDFRVLRGGAFHVPASFLRSADRLGDRPGDWEWGDGFRCALGPSRQH